MSLLPIRFPEGVSYHAVGGPAYRTSVVAVASGFEFRDQLTELGLGRWTISHSNRLPDVYQSLLAFFRVAKGRLNDFRFKDWSDFSCTAAQGVLLANGATNEYQMHRRYLIGPGLPGDSPADAFYEDRKIQLPVSGTVTVVGGTAPTVDYSTGIVTSATAPTAWAGQFDVPCRFDVDDMQAEIIDRSGNQLVIGWQSVAIVEVRL